MIQSIRVGSGFKGAAAYVLEKEGAVRLNGVGTMGGQDVATLTKEAAAFRALRPTLGKAVFHSSLSLAPDETLTDQKWGEAANFYMAKMGFEDAPWFAVRHTDAEHEHIHIVAVRIDIHGKTVSDSHERTRGAKAVQEVEEAFGLRRAAMTPREARAMSVRPHGRQEAYRFMGIQDGGEQKRPRDYSDTNGTKFVSKRQFFRDAIGFAMETAQTYPEFMEEAKKLGIRVVPNVALTGHVSGVSYVHDEYGSRMKSSKLGKAFGFKGVLQRGVEYVPERDLKFLQEPYKHESTHAADRARAAELAEAARLRELEGARLRQAEADRRAREEAVADRVRANREAAAAAETRRLEAEFDALEARMGRRFAQIEADFGPGGRDYLKPDGPDPAVLEAYKEVWNALKGGDDQAKDKAAVWHLVSRGVSADEIAKVVAQESSVPDAVGAPKEAYATVLVDNVVAYEKAEFAVPDILLAYRKSEREKMEPAPAVATQKRETIESYFGTGKPAPERPEGYQPPSLNIEVQSKKPEEPDQWPSR